MEDQIKEQEEQASSEETPNLGYKPVPLEAQPKFKDKGYAAPTMSTGNKKPIQPEQLDGE